MTFTVLWKPNAASLLAEIWLDAPDKRAVTAAADTIDLLLKNNPLDQGESRGDNLRILIVEPLAVLYDVQEDDRTVTVLSVRHVPSPSDNSE